MKFFLGLLIAASCIIYIYDYSYAQDIKELPIVETSDQVSTDPDMQLLCNVEVKRNIQFHWMDEEFVQIIEAVDFRLPTGQLSCTYTWNLNGKYTYSAIWNPSVSTCTGTLSGATCTVNLDLVNQSERVSFFARIPNSEPVILTITYQDNLQTWLIVRLFGLYIPMISQA